MHAKQLSCVEEKLSIPAVGPNLRYSWAGFSICRAKETSFFAHRIYK